MTAKPHCHVAHKMFDFDFASLMDVYRESNLDNIDSLYLDHAREERLTKVIEGFKTYLNEFFQSPRNRCFLLMDEERYLCALRVKQIADNRYLVEGLETVPTPETRDMRLSC